MEILFSLYVIVDDWLTFHKAVNFQSEVRSFHPSEDRLKFDANIDVADVETMLIFTLCDGITYAGAGSSQFKLEFNNVVKRLAEYVGECARQADRRRRHAAEGGREDVACINVRYLRPTSVNGYHSR